MSTFHKLLLLLSTGSIFAMGLVMIFNTTSAEVLDLFLDKSTHYALIKQGLYAACGVTLAAGVWRIGYLRLVELSPYLLIVFSVLLTLVLIPGIGREVNGSKRWISIGGLSFQPSEFVKLIVPAFMIYRLRLCEGTQLTLLAFVKLIGILFIPLFLIMIEPNNGTAGVIGLCIVVMCTLASIPLKYWALPLSIMIVIGAISAFHLPYVKARINVYLNPELDLLGKGHQPYQAKIAAGSGGLLGRGPGNSLQKLSYLPEAQNDYIAAIFAEEWGFVGTCSLIFLYAIFGYVGFHIAHHAETIEGFYLAAVITFLICFQAFMNLGVVSGLLPSTGLNLPFFSQGGTSLMANMIGLTLLINIAKGKKRVRV